MEKTHTLESGDDLFHKPISNDMFKKQSYGNAGLALPTSCLETPSGLIWISCTISVRPWPNRQIAKSPNRQVWLGKYTHHHKRPLGHSPLFTGNSPRAFKQDRRPSRCVPPIFLSAFTTFQETRHETYSRRGRNQRRRYRGQERQRRWSWAHGRGWWRMRGLHARVRKSTT